MQTNTTSTFRPCVVVPVYNHHEYLSEIFQHLRHLRLPCILVDDGSEQATATRLDHLAVKEPNVDLLRHSTNQGKGAAVSCALRYAHNTGYTHALQIDADGQHSPKDIPAFIKRAAEQPHALISGSRDYDSMPASRRRGRKFTDFWVCIHTLSLRIKDSMCGFRLYPLPSTIAVLEREHVGRRMDFDTDLIVRLYWEGVEIINIPTTVEYRNDITSHFNVWRDNLRITFMHTRLFFGMLKRFFPLLARRNE